MTKYTALSFVAGVMLGALLAGAYFFKNGSISSLSLSPASLVATSTKSTVERSGTVSVVDQLSGTAVVVESVTVPPPGIWIAVREVAGGVLGNVLGAARVDGPRSMISVPLLRATEPNRPYAIELYRDDGNGAFDPAINSVYVDFDTGAPVIAFFSTVP